MIIRKGSGICKVGVLITFFILTSSLANAATGNLTIIDQQRDTDIVLQSLSTQCEDEKLIHPSYWRVDSPAQGLSILNRVLPQQVELYRKDCPQLKAVYILLYQPFEGAYQDPQGWSLLQAKREDNWQVEAYKLPWLKGIQIPFKEHRIPNLREQIYARQVQGKFTIKEGSHFEASFGPGLLYSMSGLLEPLILNNKFEGVVIKGQWHARAGGYCEKVRNGYSDWGEFRLAIYQNGAYQNEYSACGQKRTVSWDLVFEADTWSQLVKNELIDPEKLRAQVREPEITFDPQNTLAYLGYTQSKLLLSDKGTESKVIDYFLGRKSYVDVVQQKTVQTDNLIALHDNRPDEPILDITNLRKLINGKLDSYQLSPSDNQYYTGLLNKLVALAPSTLRQTDQHEFVTLHHHLKNRVLYESNPQFSFTNETYLSGLMSTGFHRKRNTKNAPWQPDYILNKLNGHRVGDKGGNTFEQALDRAIEAGMTPAQLEQRYAKKREVFESQNEELAQKTGLIYLPPEVWKEYNLDLIKQILHGTYTSEDVTDKFRLTFNAYFQFFYQSCKNLVPAGSPGYTLQERTIIKQGYNITVIDGPVSDFYIKARFWPQFKANESHSFTGIDPNDLSGAQKILSNTHYLQSLAQTMSLISQDANRFISEQGCSSPVLTQFEENLYRFTQKLPYLQIERQAAVSMNDGQVYPKPTLAQKETIQQTSSQPSQELKKIELPNAFMDDPLIQLSLKQCEQANPSDWKLCVLENYVNAVNESLKGFNIRLADLNSQIAQAEAQSKSPASTEHQENIRQIDLLESKLTKLRTEWGELGAEVSKHMNGTSQEKLALVQSPEFKRFQEISREEKPIKNELKERKQRRDEYLRNLKSEPVSLAALQKERLKLDEDWAMLQIQNERMEQLKKLLFAKGE